MSRKTFSVRGESYFSLEILAECYRVEVSWVREVYDVGLLGRGERVEGTTAVEAAMLERLARILRLHRQGINLPGILFLLRETGTGSPGRMGPLGPPAPRGHEDAS